MSILAVDIGTSRTKALLARWDGQALDVHGLPTPTESEGPGQLAFPAQEVHDTITRLVRGVTAAHPEEPVDTLVFSCLGTAMLPLDVDGRPLGPALAPNDVRPSSTPDLLDGIGLEPGWVRHTTGMDLGLTSFLHHWLWLRRAHPGNMDRLARFRSLRGFLAHELAGVDAEDASWASRTMLVDLERADWSDSILGAVGLSRELLPAVYPATATWPLEPAAVERLGLARGARLVLGGMDNCCAFLGAADPGAGRLVDIVGTYEHLAGTANLVTARRAAAAPYGVLHCYVLPGEHVAMSRVPIGHLLRVVEEADGGALDQLLGTLPSVPTGERIALTPEAVRRALAAGIPPATVVQRLLESSADVLAASLQAWEAAGVPVESIVAVGGGAGGERPLRLKATLLGRPLSTLAMTETASLGAVRLAAMAVGGMSVAEACAVFGNPVVETWSPAATAP